MTGDADASMAIIVINMEVVTPSASNFCVRCDVVVVNIFLSEPLFMRNKFPDPHHAHLYGDSTIAQLCLIPRSPGIIDWHFSTFAGDYVGNSKQMIEKSTRRDDLNLRLRRGYFRNSPRIDATHLLCI